MVQLGEKFYSGLSEVDLTKDKMVGQAWERREAEFTLMADVAPVMIWRSTTDKQFDFFNKYWLDFTGRDMRREVGDGWIERVHPDDLRNCMSIYVCAFDERRAFRREFRLQRFDGEYRWLLDSGAPRCDQDGNFAGYIGSCVDVTERRHAEEVLRNFSGRLIFAQEQERRRIARDLHDDTTQQLAIVAAELDLIFGQMPDKSSALAVRAQRALERLRDAASSVHDLALGLHSTKLEYLGLIPALRSLCRDMGRQKLPNIHFSHQGETQALSHDTALCLYRVAQEALRNALKHSGVDAAEVELIARPDRIELRIQDRGKGFDLASVEGDHLGLVSMRERMRLAGGHLSIDSSSAGTLIRAVIPAASFENPRSPR